MHVNYVTVAGPHTASYRMRIDIPRKILDESDDEITTTVSDKCNENADLNVFSKHWNQEYNLAAMKATTTETVFDVVDDHFDRRMGDFYREMIGLADKVTCNTAAMQTRIYDETGRLATIIPDPVSFPKREFVHRADPKFLWFGSLVNVNSLYPILGRLPNLTVVINAELMVGPNNPHVKTIVWKPGLVEEIIGQYDVVVLPKNEEPWALTKSPNRAVDALQAGRYVTTDFREVYGELADFIFVGDDYLEKGVDLYVKDPYTCKQMVESGQRHIAEHFSPESVASKWATLFKQFNPENT